MLSLVSTVARISLTPMLSLAAIATGTVPRACQPSDGTVVNASWGATASKSEIATFVMFHEFDGTSAIGMTIEQIDRAHVSPNDTRSKLSLVDEMGIGVLDGAGTARGW